MLILGIDAGNENGKTIGKYGEDIFKTALSEFNESSEEKFGNDDMVIEYKGEKYFGGTVAKFDGEFAGSIMGGTKAHNDTVIRSVTAIHRYLIKYNLYENEFKVVVGQPIDFHTEVEKQKIISMLEKQHTVTIHGIKRTFLISKVLVSKETPFWAEPELGLVRHIDPGSGTTNLSTFLDKKFISKDSRTLPYGMDSTKSKDRKAMARSIIAETSKKWGKDDKIKIAGGGYIELYNHIKEFYPNTTMLKPKIRLIKEVLKELDPIYANAVSFYNIGIRMFKNE